MKQLTERTAAELTDEISGLRLALWMARDLEDKSMMRSINRTISLCRRQLRALSAAADNAEVR